MRKISSLFLYFIPLIREKRFKVTIVNRTYLIVNKGLFEIKSIVPINCLFLIKKYFCFSKPVNKCLIKALHLGVM